jgi:thiamine-phosphate pyrophosphorylase
MVGGGWSAGGKRVSEVRVWRVIDANANRAAEALRTLEDVARLVYEDAQAAQRLKELRHELAAALKLLDREQRLAARSTERDAGTQHTAEPEKGRSDVTGIVRAEVERVGQALRALEEFSKLLEPQASEQVKQLRYRAYDQLAHIELSWTRHAWLRELRLCILIDCQLPLDRFTAYVQLLAESGARCLQIRDKQRDDRELVLYASAAVRTLEEFGGQVIVNDRVDIALASEAAGVHVGQEDLLLNDVRKIAGSRLCVGVSTHDIEQAREAVAAGADYIGCGPSFPSETKVFKHFPGVAFLEHVAREISLPSLAIGGIGLNNLEQVLASGVRGVAVSAAVHKAEDPAAAVREFCERLG